MDFLLDEGFNKDLIKKIKNKYDESIIDVFILDSDNVVDVINYMRQIGIEKIEDLLISHIEVFTKDIEQVKLAFEKHDILKIVSEINEDIVNIEKV